MKTGDFDSYRGQTAELIASLMWGPKTYRQLHEATGMSRPRLIAWLRNLVESGVVYKVKEPVGTRRQPLFIFGMCTKPFQPPHA